MAGVALGDICFHFVAGVRLTALGWLWWRFWSPLGLDWRRVALGDICLHFVWQVWLLWLWAGSGGGFGCRWAWIGAASFCVAGVALGDICLRLWQALGWLWRRLALGQAVKVLLP
eukprot:s1845_g2.t1